MRRRSHQPTLEDVILNDTDRVLNSEHLAVLTRGLSFCPHPERTPSYRKDLERFRRSINLRLLFSQNGLHEEPRGSYLGKIAPSSWEPPSYLSRNHPLWKSLLQRLNRVGKIKFSGHSQGLHFQERAWTDLLEHPDTYLTQADKGGKAVLLRKRDYSLEAERQLSDQATYLELDEKEMNQRITRILVERNAILDHLVKKGNISTSERERSRDKEWKLPAIYFLPKIHKEKRADTGTFPGRPIIGATRNPLKDLDLYISASTSPLATLLPHSLKDTTDLLTKLSAVWGITQESSLFSADIVSLYPSIPWDEGIAAATTFYREFLYVIERHNEENGLLKPPDWITFRRILTLILKNNVFHYQDKRWFIQKSGTAMGSSISVFFANTFMTHRMRQVRQASPIKLLYLGRFLDDIVGIWSKHNEEEEIRQLFSSLTDEHIAITYDFGGNTLPALDLRITLEEGRLHTTVYRKPTDGQQYLHYSSHHPLHLKQSIPYSQLIRLKRNCSRHDVFLQEAKLLLKKFESRGYPKTLLDNGTEVALLKVGGFERWA